MNRPVLLTLLLFTFCGFCAAQDLMSCNQVVASTGKTATLGGRKYSYTVGEAVISTLQGTQRAVTQGFHQPELCALVSTQDLDLADWQLAVFPNPTADRLTVRYNVEKTGGLEATVFDLLGHVVLVNQPLQDAQGSVLDCTSWDAGLYLLQLRDPRTGAVATFRFIRL